MKAFGPDGKLYKFFSTLFMLIQINAFWLLSSGFPFLFAGIELANTFGNAIWLLLGIPVVMIGPATVAAHTIILKILEDAEGTMWVPYFRAYRANIKQGIPLGLIGLLAVWAVYMDAQLWLFSEDSNISTMFLVVGIIAIFVFTMGLIYAFPLMARYENTLIGTIKNSYRVATRFFLRTLLCVIVVGIEIGSFFVVENLANTLTAAIIYVIVAPGVVMYSIAAFAIIFFREIEKAQESGE